MIRIARRAGREKPENCAFWAGSYVILLVQEFREVHADIAKALHGDPCSRDRLAQTICDSLDRCEYTLGSPRRGIATGLSGSL